MIGLSVIQTAIWNLRRRKATYRQIRAVYPEVSHNEQLMVCLRRTALRLFWDTNYQGGADPYLSETDELELIELCLDSASQFECLTTFDVTEAARALKENRIRTAIRELTEMDCRRLAQIPTEVQPPSRPWVNDLCQRHGIRLATRREIETHRLRAGRFAELRTFLLDIDAAIRDVPSELLFNADETMLSAKRTYKCLTGDDNPQALSAAPPRKQHITAMVTVSGVGERVPLFLVLSNLQQLPDSLQGLTSRAWFGASANGWMTRFLFLDWVVCFCHWLTEYRARLGGRFLTSPAALILDGHTSRLNPAALTYLRQHNVRVVVLPAHSSHITQPFDVVVAAAFKSEFKKTMSRLLSDCADATADELRTCSVVAAIDAHDKALSLCTAQRAFRKTGIRPLNPDELLTNPYVHQGAQAEREGAARGFSLSGRVITEQVIEDLRTYLLQRGRRRPNEETLGTIFNVMALQEHAQQRPIPEGRLFSPYPIAPIFLPPPNPPDMRRGFPTNPPDMRRGAH